MSKRALLLGVCLSLSACMVYAPTYVSDTDLTVVRHESTSMLKEYKKQQTKEVSERVTQKRPLTSVKHTLADCGAFTLPREAQKPKYLTDTDMLGAVDLPALDRLIGNKMKELQMHIDSLHSKYEQAHQKWLESCMDKYSTNQ